MKRLSAMISSDSDSDEIDISKIKNQFKKSKKSDKKEISVKKAKNIENNENQMSLMTAFSNVSTSKRKVETKIDTFVKNIPNIGVNIVRPEDFFGNFKVTESFVVETEPHIKKIIQESKTIKEETDNSRLHMSGKLKTIFSQFMQPIDSDFMDTEDVPKIIPKAKEIIPISLPESSQTISFQKVSMPPIINTDSRDGVNKKQIIPVTNIYNPHTSANLTANPIIPLLESNTPVTQSSSLFVDKYSPTTLNKIVGQHGESSPANKLFEWLKNFEKNLKLNFNSENEGGRFRAALLSGPPGVGKTTTAKIVCKELGYFVTELNASSMRSKNILKSILSDSSKSQPFYKNKGVKHCVIMEEVDGMAGNEDRGGIIELIQTIKNTKHPIICTCNDRQSRKLQSFVKYVYDLRYRQLTSDQVKATLLSVAFKEKIKLPSDALNYIIKASNNDMRQVLNNLQMWSLGSLESDTLKNDAKNAQKEFKLSPFDVIAKVFSHDGVKTLSEKSDLFFQDYQIGGLFVQENYLRSRPFLAKGNMRKTMQLLSSAADSIAMGDIIGTKINTTNNWSLLPTQAMFSSVIPGECLHGQLISRIEFPSWLGKESKKSKNSRILTSLCSHLSLSTKGGVSHPSVISMDYGDVFVKRLVTPLKEGDIETVLTILTKSQLLKDDMDLLVEATSWQHLPYPLASVTPQIKATFTRAYNKSSYHLPYALVSSKIIPKVIEVTYNLEENVEEDVNEDDEKENENIETDAMITKKVKSKSKTNIDDVKVALPKSRKPSVKKNSDEKILKEKKVPRKKTKKG